MEKKNKVDEPESTDIVPAEEEPTTLSFFGKNPETAIQKATDLANAVGNIILNRKLYTPIHDKKYVWCEGWTTMGALLGLFAHIVEVEDLSNWDYNIKRFKAVCEVKTIEGKTVSRAESECSSEEAKWNKSDNYAIRSMAETRATSKTFRMCIGWIMKLTGYEVTPAEEIDPTNPPMEDIKNGDGEVDEKATEMEKELGGKKKGETNKMYRIRQLDYLVRKLKLKKDEFRKKVKDIDSFGTQTEMELAEIYTVLWSYWRYGQTMKRIKTEK